MKRSTERILTTHTGSLPRPPQLTEQLLKLDRGELADDDAGLREQVAEAVAELVRRQAAAGVAVVNDGEAGKIGYSTYVKDRLSGFGGEDVGFSSFSPDFAEFPEYHAKMMAGVALRMPACVEAVAYRGTTRSARISRTFCRALTGSTAEDVFLSAASPGVIAVFLANSYYASDEEYLFALADAMKVEYDAIHRAGFVLQIDCPDLAMGRHMLGDVTLGEFRTRIELPCRGDQPRDTRHPTGGDAPASLLGQLRRSAPS